jgi:hypothetical protein
MSNAKIGFEMKKFRLSLENILPIRQVKDPEKTIRRYKTILAAIKEMGLVEPLMVYPQKGKNGKYILVDGHLRLLALKELGETSADCIIAKDDESFTYNARISRLAPIQEHKMIMRAVNQGVKPERIAAALNLPLRVVRAYMNLLDGIHEEAVDLLKDKNIVPRTIYLLRRVTGVRQVEIAELMTSTNNFSAAYAQALILAKPTEQLVNSEDSKKKKGVLTPAEAAQMEREMDSLGKEIKEVEKTYGENTLTLTVARGFVRKLLDNAKVVRFLSAHYSEYFSEFEAIIARESL